MCDTGFEVVREAGDRVVVLAVIVCDNASRKVSRDRSARRLIGRLHADLQLRPHVFRDLDRMRWARQRCRDARWKHTSMALMMPGAPSEVTSCGSLRPRRFMSSKNAVTVSASSFDPAIRCSSTRRPSTVKPQATRTGSRLRPQPFGDAVDKQVDNRVFAQIALGKSLIVLPKPFPELRHRA